MNSFHQWPSPQDVHQKARKAQETLPRPSPLAAMRRLDTLCASAVCNLLHHEGGLQKDGLFRDERHILSALKTAPRHVWLVRCWLEALCKLGVLQCQLKSYRWIADATNPLHSHTQAPASLSEPYTALGFPSLMAPMHERALLSLLPLIQDRIDIQEVLFQGGSMLDTLSSYQRNIFTSYLNQAAAFMMKQACQDAVQPVRILELGAGLGLATTFIAKTLAGSDFQYLCTDVTPFFVQALKARLPPRGNWSFSELDINRDIALQGVAPASIDIVFAGNVLHNAFHTANSLQHIRKVMRQGAWLIFIESTEEHLAVQTCMQFLLSAPSGRPRLHSRDPRYLTERAFIDTQTWLSMLTTSGFQSCFTLPPSGDPLEAADQRLLFAASQ